MVSSDNDYESNNTTNGIHSGIGISTDNSSESGSRQIISASYASGAKLPLKSMNATLGSATSLATLDSEFDDGGSLNGSVGGNDKNSINVVVRVRPLNHKELHGLDESVTHFPGSGQIWLESLTPKEKPKSFTFNVVFEPEATQEDVLNHSGIKRLIEMAIDGFSCTIFCYGQTGSGKTHTLTGPPHLFEKNPDPFSMDHGLVFRSFLYLFDQLQTRTEFHFVLKASFLEIYNEKVIDLLNPGTQRKPLAVRWSKKSRGFFVENLFMVECEEFDDLLAVLEEGMRNRAVGKHNMNEYSSRSHTILTVHITSEQKASEEGVFISRHGKLHFVDLAGSEMTKKTQSEGKTLEEANNINKSLMVLGYCIASLSDAKKKNGHIPYRDSKLTKLLADSLAGNGVTLMIACVSPAKSNMSETLNTLRYAARAKRIRTKPVVVMDPREALIVSLKREVTALREENSVLRTQLISGGTAGALSLLGSGTERTWLSTTGAKGPTTPGGTEAPLPQLDSSTLEQMDSRQLKETVGQFLSENSALRQENWELIAVRDLLIRDQELVCRENERLLKKLEDVNSAVSRSPIAPQMRPSFSAGDSGPGTGLLGAGLVKSRSDDEISIRGRRGREKDDEEHWRHNNHTTKPASKVQLNGVAKKVAHSRNQAQVKKSTQQMPDALSRELEKRRIGQGNSITNRKSNSIDKIGSSRDSSGGSFKSNGSGGLDNDLLPSVQGKRVIPNSGSSSGSGKGVGASRNKKIPHKGGPNEPKNLVI